jgi:hypothetical protein
MLTGRVWDPNEVGRLDVPEAARSGHLGGNRFRPVFDFELALGAGHAPLAVGHV